MKPALLPLPLSASYPDIAEPKGSAVVSPCGLYRYRLDRKLSEDPGRLLWVMANPSTADANVDDPTIRKVQGFTARLGFGRVIVVNLYAYRATDPNDLACAMCEGTDVVGPLNLQHIAAAAEEADNAIVAWGACFDAFKFMRSEKRCAAVLATIQWFHDPLCLGRTRSGQPRHPLMLSYSTPTEVYS